jgi:hypothetical protein
MTLEDLLALLLFVALVLFTAVAGWLKRRFEDKPSWKIEPEPPKAPPRAQVLQSRTPKPSRKERAAGMPSVATPLAAIRRQERSPVRSLRDARRGIVLMTILGPCRGLEPPGPRDGS